MNFRHAASTLRRRCAAFRGDQRGLSAIEFALLMPLMLTMYFGTIEVTDAISADRQMALVANTVAEITSQATLPLATTDVSNIMSAASAVLAPFPVANAQITLSSVVIKNGTATVDWSTTINGTIRSGNVTNLIPTSLLINGTSLLWGEAYYAYKPVIGYVVTGTLKMYNQVLVAPRQLTCVQGPRSTLCPMS
jgi:Flp pilus assembly protein TadG